MYESLLDYAEVIEMADSDGLAGRPCRLSHDPDYVDAYRDARFTRSHCRGKCQLLITYRQRDARGRLVRKVETINYVGGSPDIKERVLRQEVASVIRAWGFAHSFDQCDVYAGGRCIRSYVRGN